MKNKYCFILMFSIYCFFALQANSQVLYGMTKDGGKYGYGTIFSYVIGDNSINVMHDFDGLDGSYPTGTLMQGKDGNLYGCTTRGGLNNEGIIFQYDLETGSFSKLHDCDTSTGDAPSGWLVQFKDGQLYGTNGGGGRYQRGTLFAYDRLAGAYFDQHDFGSATINDGYTPMAGLTLLNNKLYGCTIFGQSFGPGMLFSYDPDSNIYTNEFDFNGGTSSGGAFWGGLIVANGNLYGMAISEGLTPGAFLYEFAPPNGSFAIKASFDTGIISNGRLLLANNGMMYGMTNGSQSSFKSELFEYDTALNLITIKHVFDSIPNDGSYPDGSLIQASDGLLYGMTTFGGNDSSGTIFSYDYTTSNYVKLVDLNDVTGTFPYGDLLEINAPSGINKIIMVNNLAIYPNPATSQVTIQAAGINQGAVAQITDLTGRALITNYSTQPGKFIFDIQILAAGSYLVEVRQDNLTYTGKLVKLN